MCRIDRPFYTLLTGITPGPLSPLLTSPSEISSRLLADAGVCPRDDDRLAVQTGLAVAPSSREVSLQKPQKCGSNCNHRYNNMSSEGDCTCTVWLQISDLEARARGEILSLLLPTLLDYC